MGLIIAQFIKKLILPPIGLIILFVLSFVLMRRGKSSGNYLFVLALGIFTLLSLPVVTDSLMHRIEIYPPLTAEQIRHNDRQAIVVLGGGGQYSPEFGGVDVSGYTLVRLRYAAKLYRDTHLPILVTGGATNKRLVSEAELMTRVLQEEFSVPVTWREGQARNTAENAELSSQILNENNISRVFLVSHARHLRRAVPIFEQYALDVIPAPTAFASSGEPLSLTSFLPDPNAFAQSIRGIHEILGDWWYAIRY